MKGKRDHVDGGPGGESHQVRGGGEAGGPALSHLVFSKNLRAFIRSRLTSFLQSRGEEQWGRGERRHHTEKLRYTTKKARGDSDGRECPSHALCALSCLVSAQGRWHLSCSPKDHIPAAAFYPLGPKSADVPTFSLHWSLPGFLGVIQGSRLHFIFFLSGTHKQFSARRKGPCSPLATGRIPREPYPRHRGSRERENSQACGAWSRREIYL